MRTYRTALQKISGIESRATDMERELKINEEKYQLYVKRMEEARISGAMDKERIVNVSVAEPALPPIKPLWPKPVQNMAVALGFGLLGGLGLVFMSEFFGHHFNRSEDIERQLSIPVLSSIKEIKRKELSLASTARENNCLITPTSEISNELCRLKTGLQRAVKGRNSKIIAFSSSTRKEGNTTVLGQFGSHLARSGEKVILLDANLRHPALHNLFDVPKSGGLAEIVLEGKDVEECIKHIQGSLALVTSGMPTRK